MHGRQYLRNGVNAGWRRLGKGTYDITFGYYQAVYVEPEEG